MTLSFQPLLLLVSGALFAALFLLNILIRTLARREKLGFIDVFLAFLTAVLLVLALIDANATPNADPSLVRMGVLVIAAVLGVFGLFIALLELARPQRWRGSRGWLGIWIGGLLGLSTVTVPILARNLAFTPPEPTPIVAAANNAIDATEETDAEGTEAVDRTPVRPTATSITPPTSTATPTSTVTPTPRPSASPSPTRASAAFSTRTPTPVPTAVNPCLVLVRYNLRLRAAPNQESETLATIPFDTNVPAFGRNDASTWWYVTYEDQSGWIVGEFVDVTSACAELPVQPSS